MAIEEQGRCSRWCPLRTRRLDDDLTTIAHAVQEWPSRAADWQARWPSLATTTATTTPASQQLRRPARR
jgi:hypothetical protein